MTGPFEGVVGAEPAAAVRASAVSSGLPGDLVDGAIAALAARLPPMVAVERFPDRPQDFDFASTLTAAVLVMYEGSSFVVAEGGGARRTARLAVTLLVRGLDGEAGSYRLIEDVRLTLQGLTVAGCRLSARSDELEEERGGVWRWRMMFDTVLPHADRRSPTGLPLGRIFDRSS